MEPMAPLDPLGPPLDPLGRSRSHVLSYKASEDLSNVVVDPIGHPRHLSWPFWPPPLIPCNPQGVPLDVPLDQHTKPDYQETSWPLRILHILLLVLFEGYHTDRSRPIWSCLSHTLMVQVSDEFLQHPRTNICGWKLAETWRLRLRNGWVSQFKTFTYNSLSLPSNIPFEHVFKTQGGGWPVRHTTKVSRAKPPVFHWDWLHPVPSWQGLHRLHPHGELFWRLHHAGRRSLSNTDL